MRQGKQESLGKDCEPSQERRPSIRVTAEITQPSSVLSSKGSTGAQGIHSSIDQTLGFCQEDMIEKQWCKGLKTLGKKALEMFVS